MTMYPEHCDTTGFVFALLACLDATKCFSSPFLLLNFGQTTIVEHTNVFHVRVAYGSLAGGSTVQHHPESR